MAQSASWVPVGPDGGDGRSFAADPTNPKHIYLGTTNSWIYQSDDGGASWQRLAKLAKTDDLLVDNIVVDESDPKTLLVGTWVVDHPDGGLFISHDAGKSWTAVEGMKGQSIRALSQAPSDAKIFIAGTLKGVFRSEDSGVHWNQITPAGSMDLHEVESIAIDPKDPRTIYAGTWHLPWKTTDGGANWHNIKQGLIDDSDVFSIIIDPTVPSVVYTSACSGIYRSDSGGELYKKIQGIPIDRAQDARPDARSNQSQHRLCGHHRGLVQDPRRGNHLETDDRSRRDRQRRLCRPKESPARTVGDRS